MIELYHYSKSTCSQKVRLCLHAKRLDFLERHIDLSRREHLTPEYLALNPNGVVPTLRHRSHVITDSSVIMEYLDEVFEEVPLSGRNAVERARVREWLRFFEEVPTVAVRIPSFKHVLLRPVEAMTAEERRVNSDKRTLRRDFYRSMEDGIDDDRLAGALSRLDMTLERMETALASCDWLVGDRLSIADICVVPTLDRMQDLGYGDRWAHLPGVSRWWMRVTDLECYARTYVEGARLSEAFRPDPGPRL